MKSSTIAFLAFVATPAFAHPVVVDGPTTTKNVLERRNPHHHPHIHINGGKVLKGFEKAGEVALGIAAFLRRDLDTRALFDQGYQVSVRRSLPRRSIDSDLEARDFSDELEARDFDGELEARDFDEGLEVRFFDDDDLEARDFDDDYLEARALDYDLDELD